MASQQVGIEKTGRARHQHQACGQGAQRGCRDGKPAPARRRWRMCARSPVRNRTWAAWESPGRSQGRWPRSTPRPAGNYSTASAIRAWSGSRPSRCTRVANQTTHAAVKMLAIVAVHTVQGRQGSDDPGGGTCGAAESGHDLALVELRIPLQDMTGDEIADRFLEVWLTGCRVP